MAAGTVDCGEWTHAEGQRTYRQHQAQKQQKRDHISNLWAKVLGLW